MKDMQKMNNKTGVLLGFSVGAAALIAAACSSDPNTNPPVTPTPTGSTTANTSVTPTPTTSGTTSSTGTPTTTSSGTTSATTSTAPTTPMSACTSTDYAADNNDLATADFPGVVAYYGYGDGATSLCSGTAASPTAAAGKLCVEGNAVSSKGPDNDYQYYGAGIGLQMVVATDGVADAPWNATAAGVAAVRFTASELAGRKVRVQISQTNDPADPTKVYQDNSFLWGGTKYASKELAAGDDGVITIPLSEFALPEWSADTLGLEADLAVDPTKIYALSFQIANNPNDDTELYSFCIASLEWLDADGAVVNVVAPDPTGTGGEGSDTGSDTGAAASGGSDSAPAASGSASGAESSAPADSSGADTGAAVNFAADIQPIFTANCTSCHGGAPPRMNLTTEPNAAQAEQIVTRIKATDASTRMPKDMPALAAEDIAKIEAWANSL